MSWSVPPHASPFSVKLVPEDDGETTRLPEHAGFMAMAQLERGPLDTWPKADRQALYDAFDAGVESLEKEVAEINSNVSK
jgi:hypothetical protein